MAQLPWIQGFLFIILQLTVTADVTSVIKRAGDEVMLSCSELIDGQRKCRATTWRFSGSGRSAVELVSLGQINSFKPNRLSLTSKCSLVIKEVREEDAGLYQCQQWISENIQTPFHESNIYLSVVHLNKQKKNQWVTLSCYVVTSDLCRYKVQWFNQDVNNKESPSESVCSATVTLSSESKFPQCKVTQTGSNEEFTFSLQPSAGKVQPTIKPGNTKSETTKQKTDTVSKTSEVTTEGNSGSTTKPENRNSLSAKPTVNVSPSVHGLTKLWIIIAAAVGSVLLLTIVAAAIRWRKTEENKTWMNKSPELKLDPAGSQAAGGSSHNLEDPAGGVAYASISYTKKTSRNTKVRGKNDEDDDDTVTYSKVKPSKPSSSIDPSKLYAAINKPKH